MSDDAGGSFLEGIVDRMGSLLGDKAGQAAFQFAARSEGRRIASGYAHGETERVLGRLDAVLDHHTELAGQEDSALILRISGSRMIGGDKPVLETIALGLLEGAFTELRGIRQRVEVRECSHGSCTLEVKPDA